MKQLFSAALWFACLLLVSLMVQTPAAQAAEITGVDVLEYGLYAYDDKVVVVENDSDAAKLSNIQHLATTLDIPIRKNNFFSIKYIIKTKKKGETLEIELRVTDPKGNVSIGSMKAVSGAVTITNIEFSDQDLAGSYTLQIMQGDQELLSKTLNVTSP